MREKPRLPLSRIHAALRILKTPDVPRPLPAGQAPFHSPTRRSALFPGLFLLLGLAFALAGCSNNPYPTGQTSRPILYRALADDPKTLDPSITYTVDEASVIDNIYPSFFQYQYLKRNPFVLELSLGAEEPRREPYRYTVTEKGRPVQKQGESWTFRIKRGLRFQDDPCFPGGKGREIKAADFLYSFRRMADPTVPCPVLSFFEDKILGLHEYVEQNREGLKRRQSIDFTAPVAGFQLDPKDPYTFRILLNQPYPQLRFLMAMHFTTPLAHEAVERYGKELARHPVGCGAYIMTEYVPKQRIVLRVNPNRREEFYPSEGAPGDREAGLLRDAGKRLPLNEAVVFNIIREGVTAWNLFLQGYQDTAGVSQQNYQQVMSRPGQLSAEMIHRGVQLHRDASPNIYYFAFNMRDPLVGGYTPQKRKLRQAISLAVDSQAYIDLFSQGNGLPAQFLVPPSIFGYDPSYRNPYRQYSVANAKQLLAEAGYPNGIDSKTGEPLTIYYDNTAVEAAGRQQVGLITKQMDAIGVHLVGRSWRYNIWQDRVDHGQFQFIRYGWFADYPDPENFVFLLYGPNRRPGPNSAAYDNPEYDRLFEQMRSMDDGPARLALIRRMREIAVEDCPWIFLNHDQDLLLNYDWISNVKPHPVAMDTAKYRGVDGPRRARLQAEWNRPNYWPAVALALFLVAGSIPAAATVRQRSRRRARKESPGSRQV
jgi:oligopeptide transport system substrate-binding protein